MSRPKVENKLSNIIIRMESSVPYPVSELKTGLKSLKNSGVYKGKITGLKKAEIVNILKSLNFSFNTLPTYGRKSLMKVVGRPRKTPIGPKLPTGMRTTNTNVKKRIARVVIGPKLKRGMTYARLANKYTKEGNKQLEEAILLEKKLLGETKKKRGRPSKKNQVEPAQVIAGKRRGRPKGSKNKPKV